MKAAAILEKPNQRLHAVACEPSLVITLPFEPRSIAPLVSAQTEKIMYLEQPLKPRVLIRKETILNKFINLK